MTMAEIVEQISFMLGIPANQNVEELEPEKAVLIAFRELKRYMKSPVSKTVPYGTRIKLSKYDIITTEVLHVREANPRLGFHIGSLETTNVFGVAAAVNTYGRIGQVGFTNLDPIITEAAMAQVRNTLSTDLQWQYDVNNDVVYITHKSPYPTQVTIVYVPDYKDVSEIKDNMWIDYLLRLSEANYKKALGRTRSKYTIEGSNVSLDGDTLLSEANAELEIIRTELESHKNKLVVVN